MPEWIIALISVAFGAGITATLERYREWRRQKRVELAIYAELMENYCFSFNLLHGGIDYKAVADHQRIFEGGLTFDIAEYAKTQPDVFYAIPNSAAIRILYKTFWSLERIAGGGDSVRMLCQDCVTNFERFLEQGLLNQGLAVKMSPPRLRQHVEDLVKRRK